VHDNNKILIFGGDKGLIYNQTEELILKEKVADSQEERQRVKQTKDKLQQTHPGFSRELLGYDRTANQWKKLGELPFATPVTTSAIVDQNRIYIPSGEIRAGVRSPMLRIGKMPSTHE
jgi:N-acetylneuraminic acid mutarotase